MTLPYTLVGSDFRPHVPTNGPQYLPQIAALASGGFALLWVNDNEPFESSIRVRLHNANGDPIGNEILIDGPGRQTMTTVTALGSGGFLVSWVDESGLSGEPDQAIRARVYDSTGNPIGEEFAVNTITEGVQTDPNAIGLASGGFVITWTDYSTIATTGVAEVRAQIFDAAGARVGTEILVNTHVDANQSQSRISALPDGGFVITWYDESPAESSGRTVRAQVFDATGTRMEGEALVCDVDAYGQHPAIATLSSGNYVVVWDGPGASGTLDVHAQIMQPNGQKVGGVIVVNTTVEVTQLRPSVTALPDGGFAVAWNDNSTGDGAFDYDVRIQVFDSAGAKVGEEIVANTAVDYPQQNATIAALSSGQLVASWSDSNPIWDEVFGSIRVQMLAPLQSGTGTADTIVGTGSNEAVDGQAGDDLFLMQQGGNDTVLGGNGDDVFVFGTAFNARDRIDGGEGNDTLQLSGKYSAGVTLISSSLRNVETLIVAPGFDYRLTLAAGNVAAGQTLSVDAASLGAGDIVDFSGGIDTVGRFEVRSGSANDVLAGGGGDDRLESADGNDQLDGGAGADVMIGGNGSDTYFVDNVGDSVTETEEGNAGDTVKSTISYTLGYEVDNLVLLGDAAINGVGNASGNWLVGNSAANTLRGGGDNDTFFGGAGNDVLDGGEGDDSLDGEAGDDRMIGGNGNDTYQVDSPFDVVIETSSGGDQDIVDSWLPSYTIGANIEWLRLNPGALNGTGNSLDNGLFGNDGDNRLEGGAGEDGLIGNGGNDILDGGPGADGMNGEAGDDIYIVDNVLDMVNDWLPDWGTDLVRSTVSFSLGGQAYYIENLELMGTAAISGEGNTLNNRLVGNSAANTLSGLEGNDVLDGGAGSDAMAGAAGNDSYVVDNDGDQVIEASAAGGIDHVDSRVSFTLGANVEQLTLTGAAAINGTGNAGNNAMVGNSAANILDGGAGADTMAAGLGNDTYLVDQAGDAVAEASAAGTDTVQSAIAYTLGANVENLTLTGSGAINGTGNELANILVGNAAANTLDGKAGADTMQGGLGNDAYVVDHLLDKAIEAAGGGVDKVTSSVSFTLGAEVENLILSGSAAITGTGNGLANILAGNGAANVLNGLGGADTLQGGLGNDTYVVDNVLDKAVEAAGGGIDLVQASVSFTLGNEVEHLTLTGAAAINATGNGLANTLLGNSAANILNGMAGADTMQGGAGNDTYIVDNVGDQAIEVSASHGTDTVNASVSFTLAAKLENLTLTGSGAINATGNAAANVLIGNGAANVLNGMAGADEMRGGGGNDTYVVDNVGDQAIEASAAGGIDQINSSASFTLGVNVENLTLTGAAAINATGNGLANLLIGNTGANVLDGKAGADEMRGGAANDTYVIDNAGDQAIEVSASHGIDLVQSSISHTLAAKLENLTLTGTGSIDGTGNAAGNILTGNAAKNFLDGGAGSDTLFGGGGADRFVFANSPSATNVDTVLDFAPGSDKLVLDDAVFAALAAGALPAGALVMGSAATDANDRILYDAATGALSYDRDGTGAAAAVQFATLDNMPASLAASDFLVI